MKVATSDFPEVKVTKAGAELKTFNQSECRKVGAKLKMGPIRRLEAKSRDLACESVVSQPYYLVPTYPFFTTLRKLGSSFLNSILGLKLSHITVVATRRLHIPHAV